jgi:hypothetical protein
MAASLLSLLGVGGPPSAFAASSLPNLTYEWRFDEGSGLGVANRAAAVPTTSFPNICAAPEQMFSLAITVGGWEDMFGGATRTDAFAANPNNAETTASRLQLTATSNKAIRYRPNSAANLLTNGQTYTASCYVKSNSGATETIRLMFGDTPTRSSDLTVTVAEGWKRVSYTFTAGATCTYVGISNGSVAGAVDVLIWGFTVHAGSSDLGYTNAQGDLLFPGAGTSPTWSAGRGLTFSGATQWLMAPLGKAVTLNGVTIYVVCRQSSSLTENQRAYGAILSTPGANFGSQTLALGGGLLASSNYRHGPALSYGTTNAGATVNASATEGVLTGTDHCICATHDGTTLRILIDGHLLAEFANLKAAQTITRLLSGFVQGAAAGGYLKGDILYMAVYASGHTVAQCRTGMTGFLSLCANRTGYSAPPTSKIVIYEGDSLTLGAGVNPVIPWTRRCTEAALEPVGVQGRSFAVLGAHIGPYPENAADHNTIRDRIATDLSTMQTAAVTKTIVAWLGGTNDATDTTTGTAISNSQALGDTVRAAGAVAIPMTMPPKLNTATPNAFRATLNAAIKDAANLGVHWDAVIDTTGDAVLGPDATATNLTYYQADAIHWTQAGMDACETEASTAVAAAL